MAIQLLGLETLACYGHRINLVVKHSLEIPEISKILAKCRKLIALFHISTSLNDCLVEKQTIGFFSNETKFIGHKLIADVPTRWNSTLFMSERIVEQTPAIMAVAIDTQISKAASNNVKSLCLSFEEQTIVEGLIQVLSPFQKPIKILCAENCPTMNKVMVTVA